MRVKEVSRKPNGPAAAALLAAMIGLLVLGSVNVGTEASSLFKDFVLSAGKAWIPNAQGIGPYSGKETFMYIAWLLSWLVIHVAIRKRQVNITLTVTIFIVGLVLATLLVYTPFIQFILGE